MTSNQFKISQLLGLAALVLLLGCEGKEGAQGPQGPQGPAGPTRIFISGWITASATIGGVTYPAAAEVTVFESGNIPSVQINGHELELLNNVVPFDFNSGDFPLAAEDVADLQVNCAAADGLPGVAEASVILPGDFDLVAPTTEPIYTLPLGSDFTSFWSNSAGADYYRFYLNLDYAYEDAAGDPHIVHYGVDTLLQGVAFTIPADSLFPNLSDIVQINSSAGTCQVSSLSGPALAGETGNITGLGYGFFNGHNYGTTLIVQVEGSSLSDIPPSAPDQAMQDFARRHAAALLR